MMNYAAVSTLYVSQKKGKEWYTGFSPEADGRGNGPLNSIDLAIKRICQLRVTGVFRPMTVRILDDEYYLDDPIRLDVDRLHAQFYQNDCLTGITFEGGAKIIGGRRLCGFKEDTFNNQKCFSLHIPDVQEGKWHFTDLYVNGVRATLTRYPEEGTLRCVDTEHSVGEQFTSSKWFIAKKEDLEPISGIENAIVSYYHYWIDEHSPVESYDPETGKLTMAYRSRFLITNKYDEPYNSANLYYYLENIPEMFQKPDNWYLDVKKGMLYYIPRDPSYTPESMEVYAPTVDKIVDIGGSEEFAVSDIRFRNLQFICSKGDYASVEETGHTPIDEKAVCGSDCQSVSHAYGAIHFKNAHHCSLENCTLHNLGLHAISIDTGCNDIVIDGCDIADIGAGGVRIFGGSYGCDKRQETHHIAVRNCHISWCGRRYAAGCGILANHAYSSEFSGNEISYLDYSGISVGWVWGYRHNLAHGNLIRNNHIHHIGMGNLSDMGGIYLLGKQRGTVVSGNHIHDVICKHYGGWGIYTDEGSSYITIENNRVYNTSSNCYHQHYGSDNVVRGNVFYGAGGSLIRTTEPEFHAGLLFEENIFITDGNAVFSTAFEENGFHRGVLSHRNKFWDTTGKDPLLFLLEGREVRLHEAQQAGLEAGSVVTEYIMKERKQ